MYVLVFVCLKYVLVFENASENKGEFMQVSGHASVSMCDCA